jgi:SAM-dependent methyltransferase
MDSWDAHWSAYADAASLNPAQTYRRKLVLDLLALDKAPRPVRLLDIGSGQGDLAREIAARHPHVEILGLDLSETGVRIASEKVPNGRFFQRDMMRPFELPAEYRGWATHATCTEVLEHVDEPATLLTNVRPVLAPNCHLVVTVPAGPMSAFDRHIGHQRHFTADSLAAVFRQANLAADEVWGAGFPFFNLYRLMVIARGRALIRDVDAGTNAALAPPVRLAMRTFDWLFRWNQKKGSRGWQLVARAVNSP